jgi:hypothetical protein
LASSPDWGATGGREEAGEPEAVRLSGPGTRTWCAGGAASEPKLAVANGSDRRGTTCVPPRLPRPTAECPGPAVKTALVACFFIVEGRGKRDGTAGGEEVGGCSLGGRRAVGVGTLLAGSLIAFGGLVLVTVAPEVAGTWRSGDESGPRFSRTIQAGRTRALRPGLWRESACVPLHEI